MAARSVVEAAAVRSGERASRRPRSVSPVLAGWFEAWERDLGQDGSHVLGPYVERLARSRGTTDEEVARQWMVVDWFVRVAAPTWLRAAGLGMQAASLAQARAVTTAAGLAATAGPARDAARAAGEALEATWRAVAQLAPPSPGAASRPVWRPLDDAGTDRAEAWSALGEGVRAAIAGSTPIVAPAVAALGLDIEPTRTPEVWVALSGAIDQAVATVACSGAYRRLRSADWSWWTPLAEARREGWAAARGHLQPVEAVHERSAHALVSQLLAVTEPDGGHVATEHGPRCAP